MTESTYDSLPLYNQAVREIGGFNDGYDTRTGVFNRYGGPGRDLSNLVSSRYCEQVFFLRFFICIYDLY